MGLLLLDLLFHFLHLALILFSLLAWIWPRTRLWHLAVVGLTSFSWFVLGFFYGWGFCFLTEWHWSIREARGDPALERSYIDYLLQQLGFELPWLSIASATAVSFFICSLLSLGLTLRPYLRSKDH